MLKPVRWPAEKGPPMAKSGIPAVLSAVCVIVLTGLSGVFANQAPVDARVDEIEMQHVPDSADFTFRQAPARERYAQAAAPPPANAPVGRVVTLQGSATVTRGDKGDALKVSDGVFKGDILQTGGDGALGVTFDDETTFNLTANARMRVNEFLFQEGDSKNSALFNIARGTVAFVANRVAKTGDMKIATPTTTLGIRGTTGVVEVPDNAAPGGGQVSVKLYPDSNGAVGRIELFGAAGARLGILSRGSTGFAIQPSGPSGFLAVPLRISAQEAARDRAVVRQLFSAHRLGRQMILQNRQLRLPNLQRGPNPQRGPNLQRGPNPQRGLNLQGGPNLQRGLNLQKLPGLQKQNRKNQNPLGQKGRQDQQR